mgnify:CR=1 FL=1
MGKIGRVLIADDHSLFRSGLSKLLASRGIEVVGEAADGFEAVECAVRTTPDIVLMDVRMPRCDGLQATRRIVELLPRVRVVMLTVSEDDDDLFAAIRAGACGYLLKNVEPDELIRLLEGLTEGEAPVSGSMTSRLLVEFASQLRIPEPATPPPTHALTARELQVLRCIASGSSNREVAEHLAISENTVKNHLRSILEKLHLGNRVQAVAYAIRQGIVQESAQPSSNR